MVQQVQYELAQVETDRLQLKKLELSTWT